MTIHVRRQTFICSQCPSFSFLQRCRKNAVRGNESTEGYAVRGNESTEEYAVHGNESTEGYAVRGNESTDG